MSSSPWQSKPSQHSRIGFNPLDGWSLLCISLLSWLILHVQFPGYLLWGDSFVRWGLAKAIATNGLGFDYGAAGYQNWHSTFPTVLMALSYRATTAISSFSYFQTLLLGFTIYGVLRTSCRPLASLLATICFFAVPINALYAVLHMPDALLPIFAFSLVAILVVREHLVRRIGHKLFYLLTGAVFIICVWVRPNFAVTAFAVAFFITPNTKHRLIAAIILPVLALLLLPAWDIGLKVRQFDVSSVSFGADIVGISKKTNATVCSHCLDFVGNTENARKNYNALDVNPLLWNGDEGGLPSFKLGLRENASEIKRLWLNSIKVAPTAFAELKLAQIKSLLGIGTYVPFSFDLEWNNIEQKTADECKCVLSPMRTAVSDAAQKAYGIFGGFIGRPWLQFLLAIPVLIFLRKQQCARTIFVCYAVAISYYAGFFIQMQRVEFRYFFPTWCLLWPIWALLLHHIAMATFMRKSRILSEGNAETLA